jgi:hypothetical protein
MSEIRDSDSSSTGCACPRGCRRIEL